MVAHKSESFPWRFVVVILLGVSLFFAWKAQRIRERRTWDSTYGQVTGTHKAQFEIPPDLQRFGSPMTKPRVHTSVWTDYSYEVDGERFAGTWLESSGSPRRDEVVRRWDSRSLQGEIVLVYYDPDHPEQSVLELPTATVQKVALALSILLFIFGIFIGSGRSLSKFQRPTSRSQSQS